MRLRPQLPHLIPTGVGQHEDRGIGRLEIQDLAERERRELDAEILGIALVPEDHRPEAVKVPSARVREFVQRGGPAKVVEGDEQSAAGEAALGG